MESELIQASKQPRPQKPSSTQKQFKDQEIEHFPQGGNPQINSEELTKEQQDLLQEFREKVNSETVKESQIQNNTNISRAKNNSQTGLGISQLDNENINNDDGIVMSSFEEANRIPLNAEDLLIQENKLFKILDNIRVQLNFNFVAEEYLEFSHISSLQSLEIFFQYPKIKKIIINSQIFEYTATMLCVFVYLKGMLTLSTVEHLKNILYYCHQNLILTIELMLKNICYDYKDNIWIKKLKEIVKEKKSKTNNGKNEVVIEQNNNILFNCIGNFILLYFNNKSDIRTFSVLNDIMCNIDKCSLESVKNNLSNLKNMIIFMAENDKNSFVHVNLKGPFLPKKTNQSDYTLVLDLDETLIHCLDQQEIMPLIRPGTEKFLEEMSKYYEIVIFTASVKDYADTILNQLDPEKKFISYRLYREHTTVLKRTYLKDISKLGRDLSKIIIIDNASDNFRLQTDNGIFINTWIDDQTDTILFDLIPILKDIVVKKVPDVRKALRKIRDTMIRFYVKGDQNPFQTVLKYIKKDEEKNKA